VLGRAGASRVLGAKGLSLKQDALKQSAIGRFVPDRNRVLRVGALIEAQREQTTRDCSWNLPGSRHVFIRMLQRHS